MTTSFLYGLVTEMAVHHHLPGAVIAAIATAVAILLLFISLLIAFLLDRFDSIPSDLPADWTGSQY